MTIRRGRQETVPEIINFTKQEVNDAIKVINRLFDGVLSRGGVTEAPPQFIKFPVQTSIPTASQLDEGEVVFYQSGIVKRLYTKVNGTIRYANLT